MGDRNRMLAEGWRELAGLRVGMVAENGEVAVEPDRPPHAGWRFEGANTGGWRSDWLPDLNSRANWGHWLAWASERLPGLRVGQCGDGGPWTAYTVARCYKGVLPQALLGVYMKTYGEQSCSPPSVLAWWEAEQEARNG